jgi:hypothetical protein
MSTAEKSAFLREMKKYEAQLSSETKKEQGGGYTEDPVILKAFGITKKDVKVQVQTKLARVTAGIDKNKKPGIQFKWVVLSGANAGMPITKYIGIGYGKDAKAKEREARDFASIFQSHDIDTTKWAKNAIITKAFDAAETLTEEKPGVTLSLSGWESTNAQTKKKTLKLNIYPVGLFDASQATASTDSTSEDVGEEAGESWEDVGVAADDEGLQEHEELQAAAEAAEIEWAELETWKEIGQLIDAATPAEEVYEEEEGEAEEPELDIAFDDYVGFECTARDVDGSATTTAYDAGTSMFTVEDADGNEMEFEFGDLDFGGGFGVPDSE